MCAALADGLGQIAFEIDEELEGSFGEELLSHEQHGREGQGG
ncbi:hypothetical protein ACFSHP_26865 [Novosphingobium panipatense]